MADPKNKSTKSRSGKTSKTEYEPKVSGVMQTSALPEASLKTVQYPRANRQYKDTVFRMLFSEERRLLSLYNALNHTTYTDPAMLQVVTLKNAIYMGVKNDLAFVLQENLFLYEHQSTLNPNMPLRDLFYISSEYERIINKRSLYSSTLQKIPAPRFVVFYNGISEMGDKEEYRLSDAYECLTDDPDLELRVQVLNINAGHNKELMEQCQTLKEYAQFIECVRRYAKCGDLDTAIKKAVEECAEKNILRDFLEENKAEVIRMSIFEYNVEKEMRKLRRTEFEGGREEGRAEGREEGQVLTILNLAGEFSWSHGEVVQRVSKILKVDAKKAEKLLAHINHRS